MLFGSKKSHWEILQTIGIPMGHFWASFYLSKDECVFMSELNKKRLCSS